MGTAFPTVPAYFKVSPQGWRQLFEGTAAVEDSDFVEFLGGFAVSTCHALLADQVGCRGTNWSDGRVW